MKSFITAACLSMAALPAAATDLQNMTDAEKAIFGDLVREYLLDNPMVLVEVSQVLEEQSRIAQEEAEINMVADNADALWNDGFSWQGGNLDGDVTLVEFIDYRCGYCRRAHDEVKELVESDGNIRIILKEYPILGEQSIMASRFAIATKIVAGDDAYSMVSDGLIALRSDVNQTSLTRLAETLDLDAASIFETMETEQVAQVLAANAALGQRMQVSGTPTFVMNDELLRGYLPLDGMRQMLGQVRG